MPQINDNKKEKKTKRKKKKSKKKKKMTKPQRPYKCRYCEKRWQSPSSCRRHETIHTNERPYKCSYSNCNKAFGQSELLNNHLNNHKLIKINQIDLNTIYQNANIIKHELNHRIGQLKHGDREQFSNYNPHNEQYVVVIFI